jgi:hypothetical protein
MAEMQRQLEQMKQQLLFKNQELEDIKRRAASTRAQDTAAAQQPPKQQQQESERIKRRANGAEIPVPTTSITGTAVPSAPTVTPLFSPSALAEMASSISNFSAVSGEPINQSPAAVIARLWASCPESMSTLLTLDTSQVPFSVPTAALSMTRTTISAAATTSDGLCGDQELSRLHLLLKTDFSRAAVGVIQPFTLLGPLTAYVSRVCSLNINRDHGEMKQQRDGHHQKWRIACVALTIMRYLILNDASCRRAALLSCGYRTPHHIDGMTGENLLTRHSDRIEFEKEPLSAAAAAGGGGGFGGGLVGCTTGSGNGTLVDSEIDAAIQPLLAQLSRLKTTENSISATSVESDTRSTAVGLQALCINAARVSSSLESSKLLIGVADLLHALVTCAAVGSENATSTGRAVFLPLLRSGTILALLRGVPPQQRCRSVHLLYALLEDSQISREFAAVCAAPSTGGGANGGGGALAGDTPKTRAAAAREAVSNKKPSAAKDSKINKNKNINGGDDDRAENASGEGVTRSWAGEIMVALSSCLMRVPPYNQQKTVEEDSKTGEGTATEDILGLGLSESSRINFDGDDETALARSVLSTMALLLEKRHTACFMQIFHLDDTALRKKSSLGGNGGAYLSSSGGIVGGSGNNNSNNVDKSTISARYSTMNSQFSSNTLTISFPVRLIVLAEDSVKYRGDDEDVTVLRNALWPEGRSPAVRALQSTWQYRLRLAQEALTLLRGVILVEGSLANLALEELLLTPQLAQRMLAATGRMARITAAAPPSQLQHSSSITEEQEPSPVDSHSEMLFPALPVASWAYAIGSSSNAASLAPLAASERRAGLPCCSANDVSYLARGIKNRILYKLRS